MIRPGIRCRARSFSLSFLAWSQSGGPPSRPVRCVGARRSYFPFQPVGGTPGGNPPPVGVWGVTGGHPSAERTHHVFNGLHSTERTERATERKTGRISNINGLRGTERNRTHIP